MTTTTFLAPIVWDTVELNRPRQRLAFGLLMSVAVHLALVLSVTPLTRHVDLTTQPLQVDIRSTDGRDTAGAITTDSPSETQTAAQPLANIRTETRLRRDTATTPRGAVRIPVDLPRERYYTSREVDLRAEQKNDVQLVYPRTAYEMRLSGTVRLQLYISAQGTIDDIVLLLSDPPGVFEEPALTAAQMLEFRPAVKDGRNVRSQKTIEVFFNPYESINIP